MFDIVKFGAYIAKLRKAADMTQSELADKISVTRQAISKYERGDSFPDISILLRLSEVFGISVDNLINAGEPTQTEAEILLYKSTTNAVSPEEIVNIAPFVKPSVLDHLSEKLKGQGIDLSHLAALSEYMNSKSFNELLKNSNFETIDEELLRRLMPVLSDETRFRIFENILEGRLDWHYIEILLPFAEYLFSYFEMAVLDGALPNEALKVLRKTMWSIYNNRKKQK